MSFTFHSSQCRYAMLCSSAFRPARLTLTVLQQRRYGSTHYLRRLHSHHQPFPAQYQTIPRSVSTATTFYSQSPSTMSSNSDLTIESTLSLPNSSLTIPRLGFGIYQSPTKVCVASCLHALKSGYRHIDSAQFYANESEMGEAVRQSGIPREEVYLTTKILSPGGSPEKTYKKCADSVKKIDPRKNGYVDLFLIHSPSSGTGAIKEMWQALEQLKEEGKAKSIGVSNFGVGRIEGMKGYAKIWPPQVNQIEVRLSVLPSSCKSSLCSCMTSLS